MNAVTSQLAGLFAARHDKPNTSAPAFDGGIVLVAFALMAIGLIIVTSASMPPLHPGKARTLFHSLMLGSAPSSVL